MNDTKTTRPTFTKYADGEHDRTGGRGSDGDISKLLEKEQAKAHKIMKDAV